jgi:hypothetical protein
MNKPNPTVTIVIYTKTNYINCYYKKKIGLKKTGSPRKRKQKQQQKVPSLCSYSTEQEEEGELCNSHKKKQVMLPT